GDSRGRQSAALLIVREGGGYGGFNDRFIDLRVDDHPDPVGELSRVYMLWNTTFGIQIRMESVDRFNRNKQFAAAQEETRRVVETLNAQLRDHPDDPEILNRVAWILSTSDLAKDRAIDLARRAAKLAPGDPRIMDTLAECHYRLGQINEAIAIASELVAKEPGNDHYWNQLQKFRNARGK
ncbi:MAG TPA: tetratricopeptide repeat protein, partial [Bacteroidota bacterium]|nr:tetratricopeptide repeat protein [Bacteroidota bacterium]